MTLIHPHPKNIYPYLFSFIFYFLFLFHSHHLYYFRVDISTYILSNNTSHTHTHTLITTTPHPQTHKKYVPDLFFETYIFIFSLFFFSNVVCVVVCRPHTHISLSPHPPIVHPSMRRKNIFRKQSL